MINKQTNESTDLPTILISGKEYVLVKDRIIEFNRLYPKGSISTEVDQVISAFGKWVIKATITPDTANPDRIFTGYSQANETQGMINKTAGLENCETSAVGRALAMMGIGVIDSVASADEMHKAGVTAKTGNPLPWEGNERNADIDEVMDTPSVASALKCETCGEPAVHKAGVTAKTGKDWEAIFCSTGEKSHAKFL